MELSTSKNKQKPKNPNGKKQLKNMDRVEKNNVLGFWGFPSSHFEIEKWTFSRVMASLLCGSLRQFLTRFAQMLEYVTYVIPAALQNGTAAFDAISLWMRVSVLKTMIESATQPPPPPVFKSWHHPELQL